MIELSQNLTNLFRDSEDLFWNPTNLTPGKISGKLYKFHDHTKQFIVNRELKNSFFKKICT